MEVIGDHFNNCQFTPVYSVWLFPHMYRDAIFIIHFSNYILMFLQPFLTSFTHIHWIAVHAWYVVYNSFLFSIGVACLTCTSKFLGVVEVWEVTLMLRGWQICSIFFCKQRLKLSPQNSKFCQFVSWWSNSWYYRS